MRLLAGAELGRVGILRRPGLGISGRITLVVEGAVSGFLVLG